ncbi:MAG: sugar ABC transporter permease [Acidimicrobiia bacterium]|nr:sugar ABC transporter permease [Acidimicrobiia bacterium]
MAAFYDLIGDSATADAIRSEGVRDSVTRAAIAFFSILIGVGGVWVVFIGFNKLVDFAPYRIRPKIRPWVFVGPAIFILGVYLIYPTIQTFYISFTESGGFVENFKFVFTDPEMQIALRNNALWLIVGTTGSVLIGLLFAVMVDRVHREAFAKTFVFLPLAISMVGASVIWRFVYAWRPSGSDQFGLLNAIWTGLGNEPVAFLQAQPWNNFFLIVIMIWLQTGFAMVILSAAIKGVPAEILEAGRIDGASETQLFFRITLPSIKGAMITVATTIFIAILKVFDIVFVMTGGRFKTEVLANSMINQMFKFRNFGRASAIAVVLMLVVTPIIVINLRNLRNQGIEA